MKADPGSQRVLLDLQAVDTALAQLDHRRRTLPDTVEATRLQGLRAKAGERVVARQTQVADLEADLAKAESDLEPVRARLARNQQRIDSGAVADAKALAAMVEETEHLKRRISDLEDLQLDAMERLDDARATLAEASAAKAALEDQLRTVLKARELKLADLTAERQGRVAERDALAAALPADLLALYAKVAEKAGGVGAALLQQGRCGGCQLQATSSDLGRYRTATAAEVLRCEECGRLLVRTPESGL